MQILQNLHLNDNSKMPQPGDQDFDKLYKVRPLLETIRMNSQKAYSPHQEVSMDLDEAVHATQAHQTRL